MENESELKLIGTNVLVYDLVGSCYVKKLRFDSGILFVRHENSDYSVRVIGYESINADEKGILTGKPIYLMVGILAHTRTI